MCCATHIHKGISAPLPRGRNSHPPKQQAKKYQLPAIIPCSPNTSKSQRSVQDCCTTSVFLKIFRSLLTPWVLPSPDLLHALVGGADAGVAIRVPEMLPTKGSVHPVPGQHPRTWGSSSLLPCRGPQWSPPKLPLWGISCNFSRGPLEIVNHQTDFFFFP